VFAGLSTGSKYTLAVLILPVLLAIVLYVRRGSRMWTCLAAVTAMTAAFLVAVPYSVIDIPGFLNGIAFEASHYAGGHVGWDGDPGLPQLAYYTARFVSEFGIVGVLVTILGVFTFSVADWRRAAIVVSFPAALLWLLASQRVHFPRNALALYAVVAMLLTYGIVSVHGWIVKLAERSGWATPHPARVRIVASLLLFAIAVPWWHLRDQFSDRTDSRKLAETWLEKRLSPGWNVVIPAQMRFDARALKAHGLHVTEVDLQSATDADAFRQVVGAVQEPAVLLVPRWAADSRFPGQGTADALNHVSGPLQIVKTFGSNPVVVNYPEPVAWGDPAFGIAILGQHVLRY
jgi:prepilin signal peptidase PulO-like enzyme (type II secretory pathway)